MSAPLIYIFVCMSACTREKVHDSLLLKRWMRKQAFYKYTRAAERVLELYTRDARAESGEKKKGVCINAC